MYQEQHSQWKFNIHQWSLWWYRHESARGFYRVSVYFVAKTFCDLIPMRIIPLCPFSVIAYFMIGQLQPSCVLKAFYWQIPHHIDRSTLYASSVYLPYSAICPSVALGNPLSKTVEHIIKVENWLLYLYYYYYTNTTTTTTTTIRLLQLLLLLLLLLLHPFNGLFPGQPR